MTDQSKIRNFSIIAHIDHGKSCPTRLVPCGGPIDFTCAAEMNSALRQGFVAQNACTRHSARQRGLTTEVFCVD